MGSGNASLLNFTGSLTAAWFPALQTSMLISYEIPAGPQVGVVDLNGNITGTGLDTTKTNTVNQTTGVFELNFLGGSEPVAGVDNITADYISFPATPLVDYLFTNGADGTLPLTRTVVSSPALQINKKGMFALDRVDEILQFYIPDFGGDTVVMGDRLDYAEQRLDLFCIFSTPKGMEAQEAADFKRITFSRKSKYAAMYWPWVTAADPIVEGR